MTIPSDVVGIYELIDDAPDIKLYVRKSFMIENEWNIFIGRVMVGKIFKRKEKFYHTHSLEEFSGQSESDFGPALYNFIKVLREPNFNE